MNRLTSVVLRVLGALSLLAIGAVHLHEYQGLYRQVPTINTLFLLNFIGAIVLAVAVLALIPIELVWERAGRVLALVVPLAGIVFALGSLGALWYSENHLLFGFKEGGYDPPGITASQASEVAAAVFLGLDLLLHVVPMVRRRVPLHRPEAVALNR
jgi:hypothetical protein